MDKCNCCNTEKKEEKSRKIYSVRGIDEEVYREFTVTARELGKTIGEAMSEAMKLYMIMVKGLGESFQGVASALRRAAGELKAGVKEVLPLVIEGLDEIEISRDDLESVKRKIIIRGVARVVIKEDVDSETFSRYFVEISQVDELRAPKTIPKLLLLSRCRKVKRIIMD
ncbi:MAG: hypothetical protein DRN15_09990 [Thermoprotei archaeon]|nr:MAG: hypothetical protein DRN15_09990 [Thermoprotei archaeon]RLF24787.1 MAG: hypothetical protein DRM97_03070 [Thermoprotei archaeon]